MGAEKWDGIESLFLTHLECKLVQGITYNVNFHAHANHNIHHNFVDS